MKEEKIIQQVITTKEHIARYAGCAHQTCTETGEIFPKEWVHSRTATRSIRITYYGAPAVQEKPE